MNLMLQVIILNSLNVSPYSLDLIKDRRKILFSHNLYILALSHSYIWGS